MKKANFSANVQLFFVEIADALALLAANIKEKGIKYFQVPFLLGFGGVLVVYYFMYLPTVSARRRANEMMGGYQAQAEYSPAYQARKDQLSQLFKKLPPAAEKSNWLSDLILAACKEQGLVPDQITAQQETDSGRFIAASRGFTITLPFGKAAELVSRFESSPLLVKVTKCDINKSTSFSGRVNLTLDVATVFKK